MSKCSTSNWFIVHTKLDFFERIRRLLLKTKPCKKQYNKDEGEIVVVDIISKDENQENDIGKESNNKQNDDEENWMVLQRAVKRLHFGTWEEKEEAAKEITRIAKKDIKRKKLMVELGVIQPLVDMVGSKVVQRQRLAIQALIELSNDSFTNKAVIMEAGLLSNLPGKVDSLDESAKQEYAILFFSLSSISRIKYPVKSSQMITFVLNILDSNAKIETVLLCLGTLHNLSVVLENTGDLVRSNVLNILLRFSTSEASEKALATLGNLAMTLMGRKALENQPTVPENFIEILSKEDNPKCQESVSYILMILAHQSSAQREKMAKAKIVPVLLEVALLGSPLAQKRALKLLQWFKDERQVKMGPHSGPQYPRMGITDSPTTNSGQAKEGKKLMTNIVKQSLYKNMERITSRANGSSGSATFKELVLSSSSKSLPY